MLVFATVISHVFLFSVTMPKCHGTIFSQTLQLLALIGILTIKRVIPTEIYVKPTFQQMQNKYFSGILNAVPSHHTLRSCAMKCSVEADRNCSGFAFSSNKQETAKCLHIIDNTNVTDRTSVLWSGYEFYYLSGKLPMTHWIPPTPTLYFPLDNDTGTRLGPNPENIAFIDGGIVGNAFYNHISGGSKSFYRLGIYDSSQYCFPVPPSCSLGVTIAFWVKFVSHTGSGQAIFSTRTSSGQGIKIVLYPGSNEFVTFIGRDSAIKKEERLKIENFLETYRFGTWFHYVLRYKFDGSNLGNNMNLNLNGIPRPDSEKAIGNWGGTPGQDGRVELGRTHLNQNNNPGNIMMDEMKIYEQILTAQQAEYLYYSYLY